MDVEPVAQQLRLGVGLILISVLIGLHQIYVSEPEPATAGDSRIQRSWRFELVPETIVSESKGAHAHLHFRALQHRNPKSFVPWFAWIPLVSTLSAKYWHQNWSRARVECFFIALLWLGGAGPFTSLEQCTGRGATTCSPCVSDFCATVCKVMSEKEITLPTAPEIKASADSFKEHTGMLGSASHIQSWPTVYNLS